MCWDTTLYGSKDGRSDAPATAPRISRPHRHTAVLPMDGSERRCQQCCLWMAVKDAANVCKKRSAEQLHADGLTMGKGADIFALVSRGHRSDRIPPPEEPSESPRHFAASMDESVIVGYCTLKKCLSVAPRCLQIPKKGQKIYGKK